MSTKTDIWIPLYVGDYLRDTMHLSAAEHGAYLLLIMHYWKSGPIPDDDVRLSNITRMGDAWSNAASTIKAFFEQRDGMLVHGRLDREKVDAVANKDKKTAKAKAAADARWGKDAKGNAPSTPKALLGECPSPSPSPTPSSNEDKTIGAAAPGNTVERRQGTLEAIEAELDRQVPAKPVPVVLPDWMPMDAWNGYLAMRKKQKKVPTDRAISNVLLELGRLKAAGNDVAAVLDQSTTNAWTDVYPLKERNTSQRQASRTSINDFGKQGELAEDDPFNQLRRA